MPSIRAGCFMEPTVKINGLSENKIKVTYEDEGKRKNQIPVFLRLRPIDAEDATPFQIYSLVVVSR